MVLERGFLAQPFGNYWSHSPKVESRIASYEFKIGKAIVRLTQGDITEMATDVVVNAGNPTLMGGGGVDGAIHRKGGPRILEECKSIRAVEYPTGLPTGKAVMTNAGNLKAEKVVQTVGPIWHGGNEGEPELLKQAYINSLMLTIENGFRRVAFPSISTGAYGYPIELASRIALNTVKEFLSSEDKLDEVVLILFKSRDLELYRAAAVEILQT